MSDLGEIVGVNAVQFVRKLPGPVEHVWAHLTECDKLTGWYGDDGRIEPGEGGAVWLMGGHIRGVVTQWKPGRRLAYTWNVFDEGETESAYPESYLTFDLVGAGEEVSLTLFHLPVPERFSAQTRMGWHTYLDMVVAAARGDATPLRKQFMDANARRYGVDLNNLAS